VDGSVACFSAKLSVEMWISGRAPAWRAASTHERAARSLLSSCIAFQGMK
jgi:hypothetical protein